MNNAWQVYTQGLTVPRVLSELLNTLFSSNVAGINSKLQFVISHLVFDIKFPTDSIDDYAHSPGPVTRVGLMTAAAERGSEGRRGISIVTIVLVRRRRRRSRKPEEIDRGPEKSHKKERGGKRERGIDNREKERGRPFSAFARLFTTASGGNQRSKAGYHFLNLAPFQISILAHCWLLGWPR